MTSTKQDKLSTLSAVMKKAVYNYMKDVHTAIPGKIVEFDHENQLAKVQPLIKRIFIGDRAEDLPVLLNVPVWQPKAGGFSLTFPIKPEDECLVIFSERSLDNWLFEGGSKKPNDIRMHSLSDAICFVGMSSIPNRITEYQENAFQIRNTEKDSTITVFENKNIEIKTGSNVILLDNQNNTVSITCEVANIIASSEVNVDTPTANFTNNVNIAGDLDVTGVSTANDHISGTISGKDHTHNINGGSSAPGPTAKPN